uniref:1,4-dihydroxy-2-naphthoate octaprenyltransferase n=1 Tax=Flavobacterium sp. TaxID=239 RepID=UPI0040497B01
MKHYIQAARLRTLPLSVSGILVGSFYAISQAVFNWKIVIFALVTTIGLQILSNFANDYGDGVKGTDNEDRIGPKRALQSGVISPEAMKRAIIITAILTFISAVLLIYFSFKKEYLVYSLFFLVLGIVAIASAIRYTVGKSAYGYKGFGDVFVFFFFGWVSTIGSYFLFTKSIDFALFLPATAIGFLSVAVLNLNNMRDEASDRKANKNTLVVQKGGDWAKKYHTFLIVTAMILMVAFGLQQQFALDQYLYVLVFIPLILHLKKVSKNTNPVALDPELKVVALSTFGISVLLAFGLIYLISDLIV